MTKNTLVYLLRMLVIVINIEDENTNKMFTLWKVDTVSFGSFYIG